jgi:vacuolar-type H+-ATPase subunit I/STV1
MSIARLKKVTVCGLLREKQPMLEVLQALGCMHLVPLRAAPAEVEKVANPRAEAAYRALRFLTDMRQPRRQITHDPAFDVDELVARVLDVKGRLRDATDRHDFLQHRIEQITPWGDLSFPPLSELAGYRLWFYVLPLGKLSALEAVDRPWQVVHRDHRFAYVVLISKEEPPDDLLPVARTHTGALPLQDLRSELERNEVGIEDLVAERHALTRYIYLLSVNLAEAENRASLRHAHQQTRDEDGIVALQGWVPQRAVKELEALASEQGLATLIEEPGSDETPPTLLEEAPEMKAGTDLAMFYTVPPYRSWDPSQVLFFSFSIFFAMILSDAGYALLLMGLLLSFWRRLGGSESGRAYRVLGLSMFGFAIVYGILVGSYFGLSPADDSILGKAHVLNVDDYQVMMKISIIIGVLHLVIANALVACMKWPRAVAFAHLGWIVGLIGGLLAVYGEAGGAAVKLGYALLIAALLMIALFSSERAFSARLTDLMWRTLDGFKALSGVMGMFGDVLSYMRLFALGLASASLAITFNGLAIQVKEAVPGLGLLLMVLILLIGHAINLALSIMSGVVHGLRLNFIEFYKWGMPGEGKSFQKFARKEIQP